MLGPDSHFNVRTMPNLEQNTRHRRVDSNRTSVPAWEPLQSGFPAPSGEKQSQPLVKIDCGNQNREIQKAQQLSQSDTSCYVRGLVDPDLRATVESWKECNSHFPDHTIYCDPEWIAERFKKEKENIRIFFLEKGKKVVGAVPFLLARKHLECQLSQLTVAKFPMRVLRLLGYTPNMPAEESTYDTLIDQVLRSDCDAIYMNHVRTDSFLWNYLRGSQLIRKWFWCYRRTDPLPHLLIRLDGTFEHYMQKFPAKLRQNWRRTIRLLQKHGEVQLMRITSAPDIDAFLEAAYGIDRTTWQFRRFGRGLAARDLDVARGEMHLLARRGWLRSYLLKCGDMPCSFVLGQQYGSTFYPENVGIDDKWSEYSVGTIILGLILEDLFRERPPQVYDFGSHVKWQELFATESYPEVSVWLFRRRSYPLLAGSIYRACNVVSTAAGAALERFGLRSRVRRLLWR